MNMTLASAYQAALARATPARNSEITVNREDVLLAALERSATSLDQIMQRRLGLSAVDCVKA
jgi:hypothetical protein